MITAYDYINTIIQIFVMIYIQIRLYKRTFIKERSIRLVFFFFAIVANLLSELYWLAFDILYPSSRMPFAANEIGECAIFLSLAASIALSTGFFTPPAILETIGACIFITANVALWIAWSGEWIQDIITGIVVAYFFSKIIKHIKQTGALSSFAWKILGMICVLVIAANTATFFADYALKKIYEMSVCFLMLSADLYFMIRTVLSLKRKETGVPVSHAFASMGWNVLFLYMSEGVIYNMVNVFCSVSFLLMFLALVREPES